MSRSTTTNSRRRSAYTYSVLASSSAAFSRAAAGVGQSNFFHKRHYAMSDLSLTADLPFSALDRPQSAKSGSFALGKVGLL
jgi:hypothetical protein